MPVPATTSHDKFLRTLLSLQVDDLEARVEVTAVLAAIPRDDQDVHKSLHLPSSVVADIRFLERHKLLEFYPDNPHVKLTALGIYAALLFEPLQ